MSLGRWCSSCIRHDPCHLSSLWNNICRSPYHKDLSIPFSKCTFVFGVVEYCIQAKLPIHLCKEIYIHFFNIYVHNIGIGSWDHPTAKKHTIVLALIKNNRNLEIDHDGRGLRHFLFKCSLNSSTEWKLWGFLVICALISWLVSTWYSLWTILPFGDLCIILHPVIDQQVHHFARTQLRAICSWMLHPVEIFHSRFLLWKFYWPKRLVIVICRKVWILHLIRNYL